jgi:hypothetical protein
MSRRRRKKRKVVEMSDLVIDDLLCTQNGEVGILFRVEDILNFCKKQVQDDVVTPGFTET